MNNILDKILLYEARAEFCQIFRSFFGQSSFKKEYFWDLLTCSSFIQVYAVKYKLQNQDIKCTSAES